jgi:hypothetical protein
MTASFLHRAHARSQASIAETLAITRLVLNDASSTDKIMGQPRHGNQAAPGSREPTSTTASTGYPAGRSCAGFARSSRTRRPSTSCAG